MKKLLILGVLVIVLSLAATTAVRHGRAQNKRRLNLAQLSFATGCYAMAQVACFTDECNNFALENCEPSGVKYREWLENDSNEQNLSEALNSLTEKK